MSKEDFRRIKLQHIYVLDALNNISEEEAQQKLQTLKISEKYKDDLQSIFQQLEEKIQADNLQAGIWQENIGSNSYQVEKQLDSYILQHLLNSNFQQNLISCHGTVKNFLEEYNKFFEVIYNKVKECSENNLPNPLQNMLKSNIPIDSIFSIENGKFANIAINKGNTEVLKILLSNNEFNLSNLLELAIKRPVEDFNSIEILLQKCDSRVTLDFLQGVNKDYFYNNENIKKLFLAKLEESDKTSLAHYKAMYSYNQARKEAMSTKKDSDTSKEEFRKAIKYFGEAIKNNSTDDQDMFLRVDHLYKGFCYQYIGEFEAAEKEFKTVLKWPTSSEATKAKQHLDSLETAENFREEIKKWQESHKDEDSRALWGNYSVKIKETLTSLSKNITSNSKVTSLRDELTKYILKSRYDSIKDDLKKKTGGDESILLYQEFETLPQLRDSYTQIITTKGFKNILDDYINTTKILDETLDLVGKVTEGLVIEDIM